MCGQDWWPYVVTDLPDEGQGDSLPANALFQPFGDSVTAPWVLTQAPGDDVGPLKLTRRSAAGLWVSVATW